MYHSHIIVSVFFKIRFDMIRTVSTKPVRVNLPSIEPCPGLRLSPDSTIILKSVLHVLCDVFIALHRVPPYGLCFRDIMGVLNSPQSMAFARTSSVKSEIMIE